MGKIFALPFLLLMLGCHNTNPDQGSGGKKVEKNTTLSNASIVDSTKAIIDQAIQLQKKRENGSLSESLFSERYKSLMATYKILFHSLSPSDTINITNYRDKRMKERSTDSLNLEKTMRWQ
ncbi:hypothetical protein EZ449_12845 [Pedobacter frigidisoli]|uniref:DUF4296 domain-containing protein n=1 Tax=Pedobacter frigidisoli TaxID=2530455 RepID=A0A4R0NZH8_9SPHI|nr:hypothetical protein [Pedobacter frigidisoli]TCD08287.1 hypothetical protein EZ449_12845 [Pedobacter frigidisoli]